MKRATTSGDAARRACLVFFCVLTLSVSAVFSRAFTTAQFVAVQSQITNDIATLSALPSPTREERALLRSLNRATVVCSMSALGDGKALFSLNTVLGRTPSYTPSLTGLASNLLVMFNTEYSFVATLLAEMPPSDEATAVTAQYAKLAPAAERLEAADTIARFAALYDLTKSKLDKVYLRASRGLVVPFPAEMSANSVSAKINGVNFRTSSSAASDNLFQATATASNINLTINGLLISGGDGSARGLLFSVPNAQTGTFRYMIPDAASFTNRTAVYSAGETNVGATSGAIFVSTTATEVFGSFTCSGPGFNVTDGKFRITLSSTR